MNGTRWNASLPFPKTDSWERSVWARCLAGPLLLARPLVRSKPAMIYSRGTCRPRCPLPVVWAFILAAQAGVYGLLGQPGPRPDQRFHRGRPRLCQSDALPGTMFRPRLARGRARRIAQSQLCRTKTRRIWLDENYPPSANPAPDSGLWLATRKSSGGPLCPRNCGPGRARQ